METYYAICISLGSLFIEAVAALVTEKHILGSNIELDCQTSSINLCWRCPNGKIIYEDSKDVARDHPYKEGSKLKILNIQMEDRGIYDCVDKDIIVMRFNVTIPALVTTENPSYYRNLKIDKVSQILVAGSMNHITVFDLSQSVPVELVSTEIGPSSDNVDNCRLSHTVFEIEDVVHKHLGICFKIPYCQNHFRILSKISDSIFLVCGTNGDSPTGYEFNITDGSYTETGHVPCSNDPFHNSTSVYVESTDGKYYMYYGSIYYNDKTIQRPVYGSANAYMKGVDSTKWLQEPQFVGSFDLEDEILFFFREKAIEVDPRSERIYSRVAKVCKKDVGGNTQLRNKWTSYQKARLSCVIPGKYPSHFDIIEDVQTVDGITFYGLFTSGNTGVSDSAICAFSITDIKAAFNGKYKHQPTSDSFWQPTDTNLSPRPGQCVDDSLNLSDDILQFIADKPLMDDTVNSQADRPLFIMEQVVLQKLEIHGNMTELVFYAASNLGEIYKLFLKDSTMYSVSNFSVVKQSDQPPVLWELRQYGDFVYVGTDHSIQQIRIINCEKYLWVDSCVRDPHCAWINNTDIIPEDGENYCNRCRPLSYVQNNGYLNEVGIFTHRNSDLTKTTPLSRPPSPPKSVRSINASTEAIDLEWINGDDGGYRQSFVIEYRQESAKEWEMQIHERSFATTSYSIHRCTINNFLRPGKSYELRVLSMNVIGNSSYTSPIVVSTKAAQASFEVPSQNTCVMITYIIVAIVLVLFAIVIIVLAVRLTRLKRKLVDEKETEKALKDMKQHVEKILAEHKLPTNTKEELEKLRKLIPDRSTSIKDHTYVNEAFNASIK